ncbi:MAG: PPC domain-containing protein, partial [Acidobacteria bacterium]|nr:PPC domain-containing protein [Acidobacteriota bacterium]
MSRYWLITLALPLALAAQPRTNPPTLLDTNPAAITRGLATEVRVEGINLRGASAVFFDETGITGKVLHVNELGDFTENRSGQRPSIQVGAFPPRNQVTLEVTADPDAQIGIYRFRLLTKEGTTNTGTLSVEPYFGETAEIEPNDTIAEAMLQNEYVYLPAIVAGTIRAPGDEDHFTFRARAGQELVFDISAQTIGSTLRWGLELYDAKGSLLAKRRIDDSQPGAALAYRIPADGRYTIKVFDVERGGSRRHAYRLKIGEYPYLTGVYPLGIRQGEPSEVTLQGFHLGDQRKLTLRGAPSYQQVKLQDVSLKGAHNKIRLAVGEYPEVAEQERVI